MVLSIWCLLSFGALAAQSAQLGVSVCHDGVSEHWHTDSSRLLRVGEAQNPGPSCAIHLANPTGLRGKEGHLLALPGGILNVAESHLTAEGIRSSTRTLKSLANQQHRRLRVLPGAPVALRTGCRSTGVHSGVLQASDLPGHSLTLPWQNGEHALGRVQVSKFAWNQMSLQGAVLYAWSPGPTWPQARAATRALLDQLTTQFILGSDGPRFVSGDFNGDSSHYPVLLQWEHLGWREIQTLHQHRTGEPPKMTCKGATQPDRIYVSPELARFFHFAEVTDLFADHSVVSGHFNLPDFSYRHTWWPMPQPLPWDDIDLQHWHSEVTQSPTLGDFTSSTEFLADFGKQYERSCQIGFREGAPRTLPTHCRGRAQTWKPQQRSTQMTLVRTARAGEEAPASSFINRQVQRWFRQLRRIQSLLHNMRRNLQTPQAVEYRLLTWRAIQNATGFDGPFALWWLHRPIKLQSALAELPVFLPPCAELEQIFLDFQYNYRSLEHWHLSNRQKALKLKYQESAREAFRVVRQKDLPPMAHLTRSDKAEILEVDPGTFSVTTDADLLATPTSSWFLEDSPAKVLRLGDRYFQVESDLLLCPGQVLELRCHLTSTQDMLAELSTFWQERWNRHQQLPESAWDRILAFVKHHVPHPSLHHVPLTLSAWEAINQRYQVHSAKGPDGFDRLDLWRMPHCYKQALMDMYAGIENSGDWPHQMLQGFGYPLPKSHDAAEVQQYRPVIILSMLYRSWSSHHARAYLAQLRDIVGPGAYGFLPGRETGQLWGYIQASVELSLQQGHHLCGYTSDIVKAFEMIPRSPLKKVMSELGFADQLLVPWFQFLANFERRFCLDSQVGPSLCSTSGLPEGCGLSVLGMVVIDWILDVYAARYSPKCQTLTFVDNLEVLGTELSELFHGQSVLQTYLDSWCLTLDAAKSYFWSTSSQQRTQLRSVGLSVKLQAADLGGALVFSKRRTAGTQLARLRQLEPSWIALRKANMEVGLKQRLIVQALWPRAFHAISITLLGGQHLRSLRTAATRALGFGHAGSHPGLRLCLLSVNPCVDPACYQLLRVFLEFRRLMQKDARLLGMWQTFMSHYDGQWYSGPFSKLLEQCALVHWQITTPPCFRDHDGLDWNLATIPEDLLRLLLLDAWRQQLAEEVSHRADFSGLTGMQWPPSVREKRLTAVEQARVNALRDGSFICRDRLGRFDLQGGSHCELCHQEDSWDHRALECPALLPVRLRHPEVVRRWTQVPLCLSLHLMAPRVPLTTSIRRALCDLQDLTDDFQEPPLEVEHYDLFSDGSAWQGNDPAQSLAAWALVSVQHERILAAGPVSGLLQTVNRAELLAGWAAVQWAVLTYTPTTLWSDSAYVCNGLYRLLQDETDIPDDSHEDLWIQISLHLVRLPRGFFTVQHVPGHLNEAEQDDPVFAWAARWNGVADRAAGNAHRHRPECFTILWQQYQAELAQQRSDMDSFRLFHLDLAHSRAAMIPTTSSTEDDDPEEAFFPERTCTDIERWIDHFPFQWSVQWFQQSRALRFGRLFPVQFVDWLTQESTASNGMYSISWLELATAVYNSSLRHPIPSNSRDTWVDAHEVSFSGNISLTVSARIVFIRSLVRELCRCFELPVLFCDGLNLSHLRINFPVSGIVVGLSPETLRLIDSTLRDFTSNRAVKVANDFSRPFHR